VAKHTALPAAELLIRRYEYSSQTGELRWRIASANGKRNAGDLAGKKNPRGIIDLKIDGTWYKAHRIIWKMVTGRNPGGMVVDHKDGNPSNNRFENLRLADWSLNNANSRVRLAKQSGLPKGVTRKGRRFVARIGRNGSYLVGAYDCPAKAHEAYLQAARQQWGEFANGGTQ
jgi:hypothetical protein